MALQEVLQDAPAAAEPGAASQASLPGRGPPPSTPPRGFPGANGSDTNLAAGMPITPAPSLSKECGSPHPWLMCAVVWGLGTSADLVLDWFPAAQCAAPCLMSRYNFFITACSASLVPLPDPHVSLTAVITGEAGYGGVDG